MSFVRHWLPAVICVAGVLVIVIGRDENAYDGGAAIIGAGLSVWLLNFMYRVGVTGDDDRDEEDAARAFFDEHGHWPDEPAPPPRAAPVASEGHPHDRVRPRPTISRSRNRGS